MENDFTDSTTVTLCALTYHRPNGVSKMLEGLGKLTFSGVPPLLRIVIVDNDPAGSARQAVSETSLTIPWTVHYCIESHRGISYARNRALAEAGESEWIGFIDDDEVPCPDWLDELLRIQREYDGDAVAGPVLSKFSPQVPPWIPEGGFFNQMRYATGTLLPYCFTNNVIFRARIIRELNLTFDDRFALTGGEDRHFFQCIGNAGYRIVWADDACVLETVPDSRACPGWILQRSYRCGNTVVATDLATGTGKRLLIHLFIRACLCAGSGVFFFLLTWPLGKKHMILHLQDLYWGAGMFSGLFGSRYVEYKIIHGK